MTSENAIPSPNVSDAFEETERMGEGVVVEVEEEEEGERKEM